MHLTEDWQINRSSLRRFALGLCKEFAVTLTLTSTSQFICAFSSVCQRSELKQWHCCEPMCLQGVEESVMRWRRGTGPTQRSLIFCWVIDFQVSLVLFISLSLFSWPLARSWTPSQVQMSPVPAERLIFLPRLLIPQLCSVFKMLRCLLGASNKEDTVTGEEKGEKERAGVTRYQWNQIYLTCPWATFIF